MTTGWRVAVDRGGTFTDIVAMAPDGTVTVRKVPSDPADASHDGAVAAIREVVGAGDGPITADVLDSVRCGTTVATNALLERRGERCALLVTAGFRDLLVIGTQERPDLFALEVRRERPLPERAIEIPERVLADGTVRTPLDEDAVRRAAAKLIAADVKSVCIAFLHSYAEPAHERRTAEILRAAGIRHVAASHEIAREVKVVPRAATAAADAYLTPVLRRSLDRFRAAFADDVRVGFMESHGGLTDAARASGPRAVLSGPAGGALAAASVARLVGATQVIGFDMGGTSTDVCRWAGEHEIVYETRAAGVRLQVPALRLETVAAGGGSRLTFDGRRLCVGPESVGAVPGPAGYGRGGAAALTDANAVLGRLVPQDFPHCFGLSGTDAFDVTASRAAVAELADAAGLEVEEAALGFVRIAVARMAQAIREVSVSRGHDVRAHALVCFGGAGGQHACALAAELGMRTVLVHPLGSVLSAWGIGGARLAHEEASAVTGAWGDETAALAEHAFAQLAERGQARLVEGGVTRDQIASDCRVELRYAGVDHTIAVPFGSVVATANEFHIAHRRLFGFARRDHRLECVAARLRTVEREQAETVAEPSISRVSTSREPREATVWFVGPDGPEARKIPVLAVTDLTPGENRPGPALIVDSVTTVLVEPGWQVELDASGLLRLRAERTLPPPRPTSQRDPVFLALFSNAFMSIAERMGAVLERVSHSTSIKERLDFSCAVFDGERRLIANAPHIPVHLGAMGESVRAIAAARGRDLREGDVFLTNDPTAGGSHLPDITAVTPVGVRDGQARYWIANRAHHADVGGVTPGSMPPLSESIDEEGVRLHDVLLLREGALRETDVRAVLSAGPYPARGLDERIDDLRAQAAANAQGAQLLAALAASHGADVVSAYMGHVLDDGEAAMRELLDGLADGRREHTDVLDDGTPLCVSVTIDGQGVIVDFAGTGPRSRGNLNAPRAVSRAAVLYALRTLISRDVPLNEGCLRPVEIRIPAGSLLDPQPGDAVVGGNVETSMRVVDVVLGALGAVAASQGTMNNVAFGPEDGSGAYYETIGGGSGAGPGFDGESAVQSHMTNTRITDPEVLEHRWPVILRRFGVRDGSGGEGRWRGGDGAVRELEMLAALRGGILSERRTRGAFGLEGGRAGAPGRNLLIRDGEERELPGRAAVTFREGDILRIETPGGGGYGSPD